MSKPRLLFISNLFPDVSQPYRGLDNATLLHHLREAFEIRAIALRPMLFTPQSPEARECDRVLEPLYVPVRYVPKLGSLFNPSLMVRALREPLETLRKKWPFEVVLSSWIFPDSCAVAALARDFPFVSIAQGSDVHQYLKMPLRRRAIVSSMRKAAGVVTRSAALASLLADAGLPREKLHPVYNGIDFTQFRPGSKIAARIALGLPGSAATILFVGNLLPMKNPLLLLRAHAQLTGAHLILVGGGPLEKEARQLAAELGTTGRVTFAGRRSVEEVARYMQAADVLALPSRNEGVPNVILEAFACGLPVVASRVGGIPEVHNRDFLGQLIPEGDVASLVKALRHAITTPADKENIRCHAAPFSWEATTLAYTDILNRALADTATKPSRE